MIDCRPKFKIQKNWSYNWVTVTASDSFITHGPTRAGVAARTSSTAGGHVARRCWGLIDIFILNVRTRPIFYILFSTLVILFLMRNQNLINSSFWKNLYRVKLNKYSQSQTTRSSIAGAWPTRHHVHKTCTSDLLDVVDSDAHKLHAGNSCSADIATTNILQHTPHDNKHSSFVRIFCYFVDTIHMYIQIKNPAKTNR